MYRFLIFVLCISSQGIFAQPSKHVILITFDGLRWQDVFRGADSSLMKQQKALKDHHVKDKYWRADVAERRKALLPFLWTTIAAQGQIHGNRDAGSRVNVTNTMWFSYPGYHEILAGFADDARITSNNKVYNPNATVLEFIHQQPGFKGTVAAFTSWDVFPYIINDRRSGIFVSGGEVPAPEPLTENEKLINRLMVATPNMIPEVRLDAFTFYYGLEYLKKHKPRVLYFSFDETDDFAHSGEYAAYLNSARKTDQFLAELWEYLQSEPVYRNKTTLIITTDHGRGPGPDDWKRHGAKVNGADEIWIALLGPNVPATGESRDGQRYQSQIAATLAESVGIRYTADGKAGRSLLKGK